MIKLQCIGHLGKDAIVNQVNGKNVVNFNVAHSEKYKDNQGTVINKTVWVSCAYWSDKTAIAQYLLKGTQVYVEGTPDVKIFKDSQGATHANMVLRVNNIQLLGGSRREDNPQQQSQTQNTGYVPVAQQPNGEAETFDDLPF